MQPISSRRNPNFVTAAAHRVSSQRVRRVRTPDPEPARDFQQLDSSPSPYPAERAIVRYLTTGFVCVLAAILAAPFFSSLSWTNLFQDDFFYYLLIAQNIAHGHGSTFNGIVSTNGYHPLWLALLTLLSFATSNPKFIPGFVAVSIFAASMATFLLARRLVAQTGVRPLLAFALAGWTTVLSFVLFCEGMEINLALPLLLGVMCLLQRVDWLLERPRQAFLLGLLVSAMVLSRLDTLLFAALLLFGIACSPSLSELLKLKPLLAAGAGLLPLPAYFIFNRVVFHTWLPISGMAKELKFDHLPSRLALSSLTHDHSPTHILVMVSIILALPLAPIIVPRLSAINRVIMLSAIVFPFLYYTILSVVSDWKVWPWYWYALRPAFCVAMIMFCLWRRSSQVLQRSAVVWLLSLAMFGFLIAHGWKESRSDVYDAAVHTQEFAATHPGVYAMGDRAGLVAYLLPYPMIQLEGLVMDPAYLALMRRQTPLKQVLAAYHVRYYIATWHGHDETTPCFNAVEPYQAGPHAAHISDQFCQAPAAVFPEGGKQTVIYDLGPQPPAGTH